MFCVLSVRERNRTIFERIFGKLLTDDYSVKTIPVYKGAPFFSLDITTSKKEINWEDVIFAVGKCASRLVLNGHVRLPENPNIKIAKATRSPGSTVWETVPWLWSATINGPR